MGKRVDPSKNETAAPHEEKPSVYNGLVQLAGVQDRRLQSALSSTPKGTLTCDNSLHIHKASSMAINTFFAMLAPVS